MKDFPFIQDEEIQELAKKEAARQANGLEMIPSENHTSQAVLDVLGSRLTDKYSEGYPGGRYYGGCEFVDKVENICIDRAKQLFGVDHANVQAYSGSPANQAVYYALLNPGDTVLGLHLFYGGHMTHGLKVNFSGTLYNSVQYQTDKSGFIDYEEVAKLAREHKPKLIVGGYTAYPRIVDWKKLRAIADEVGAFLLADISHISGLVISGDHPSPVGIADVVMTTTHKGLRGPRGALILANGNPSTPLKKVEKTRENIPSLIDRAIIPGLQGGPHNHQTAAIAVALKQALQPEFKTYGNQVAKNAKVLSEELIDRGFELVTGGTDTHLMVVDMNSKNLSGRPYPGLNMDNLPYFVPITAVAKGRTLIHDWSFENRAIYYTELTKIGATIDLADRHRVYITGPTKFRSADLACPPALRPASLLLIGMMAAKGTSMLRNVYTINRGYEDIARRLNSLGANIEVLHDI